MSLSFDYDIKIKQLYERSKLFDRFSWSDQTTLLAHVIQILQLKLVRWVPGSTESPSLDKKKGIISDPFKK